MKDKRSLKVQLSDAREVLLAYDVEADRLRARIAELEGQLAKAGQPGSRFRT